MPSEVLEPYPAERSQPPAPVATVVIVNWNGAHLLPACLDALLAQRTSRPFQVVVVDNASSDGSLTLLQTRYPAVRVVRNAENRGFAGGNNSALEHVTTPYAVLLNNDATPEPEWLERLLVPFDEPGAERLAAVSSKVVFAPRFLPLELSTEGFSPGPHDPRELGLRVLGLTVDGEDVTEKVLWERLVFGPEGEGAARFRWTRPAGELLVPLPAGARGPYRVVVRWAAERAKDVRLSWQGGEAVLPVTEAVTEHSFEVAGTTPVVDVVNNAGSIVFHAGYGADRGFQEVDTGQYDQPREVFALCGCAVAFRTEAGRELGWFDDDFFLYYEDTDLSWRLRLAGWSIRYEPTAVVRHIHSASSVEWSPRFVFHTDRNRLLMLVKNATAARAVREVGRYPLTTASIAVRAARQGWRDRRRPAVRQTLMRLKVLLSFLRLLPAMLAKRAELSRTAAVPRTTVEQWLVTSREEAP
ncbi:MAG: putative glycosyl transferase [Frankiales bacterium]|nr:putative glycosyl transferase [Frankiales bacterium]